MIPLKGRVSDVHTQLVPTILGVVRNAFVEGLAGGFADLPPETAPKKEGVIKQTLKALKKFVEVSNAHTPYLLRKAHRIEEYLNQR